MLADALDNEAIRCALVFGSVAAGTAGAESDIDLLVIGDIGLRKVTELLAGVGDRLGREINSHVLSPAEFASRVASKEHFVTSVMRSKKIFVKGSQRELAQWQNNGWLRPHTTSREEIENLLGIARRDLSDALREEISDDWRFGIAYNAALKLCAVLLYAEGYRPAQTQAHYRALQSLPLILGAECSADATYLDACRVKRNTVEYDYVGGADQRGRG